MTNNKLKNMIGNHELDDFVNNEDLKEQLCKLQTSEEVLELLKKYNYHESKEVFEVELMGLLKEFVGEEELLKVSGGKLNKQSFSNIVTSLAITGSLCMPVQGVTGVQQKEKREDKKSSYSVGLPPKEKAGLGVCGIVGVGVLLGEVLRRKVFAKKDKHYKVITEQKYKDMKNHFMKIATKPQECNPNDLKKYTLRELADYAFAELIQWFENMDKHYTVNNGIYAEKKKKPLEAYSKNFIEDWKANMHFLLCISLAYDTHKAIAKQVNDEYLQNGLRNLINAQERSDWTVKKGKKQNAVPTDEIYRLYPTALKPEDTCKVLKMIKHAVVMYTSTNPSNCEYKGELKRTRVKILTDLLPKITKYVKSTEYQKILEKMKT